MAGGGFAVTAPAKNYDGKLTASVIITCLMAASGGLIFGYDIGISGGVSTMRPFLEKFFPKILQKMKAAKQDQYCIYDSQLLTTFTSSLYIAGLFSSLIAGKVTKIAGRRIAMIIGGLTFLAGAAMNAAAMNIMMLILGRTLLGVGVGFTNQATPVYLAEVAPAKWRGAFNTCFQFFIGIGVLAANLTNYYSAKLTYGWRLSLGLAAVPACVILIAALFISDTPTSLAQRGHIDRARAALRRFRGGASADVDAELDDILQSLETEKSRGNKSAFRRILKREYRPQVVVATAVTVFQQLTGVVVIAFFSPVLFRAVGFGGGGALLGAALLGGVNLAAILVSTVVVDRYGRRALFIQGGVQMFICQVAVALIMAATVGTDGTAALPRSSALAILILVCAFSAGFGWSWGPLNWLIPSEILPTEIRSVGQSVCVAANFTTTIIQTQCFLAMLCHFKYGIFIFYATWVAVMTAFVVLFVPETRGVPLESMGEVWETHWYWKRFVKEEEDKVARQAA